MPNFACNVACNQPTSPRYGVSWVAKLDAEAHLTGAYLTTSFTAAGDGDVGLAIEFPGSVSWSHPHLG